MDPDIIIHFTIPHWEMLGLYWVACSWIVRTVQVKNNTATNADVCLIIAGGFIVPGAIASMILYPFVALARRMLGLSNKPKGEPNGTDETDT